MIEDDGYTFEPRQPETAGFILCPGGRVDPAGYAASARLIAEAGYLVVVPELRLNLAVLDADAADDIIAAHPEIERWAIGGHSFGGAIAASYADDHRDTIAGLVLWAAYPADSTDLSTLDAAVASVFGTRDGLSSLDDIEDSRSRLPPTPTSCRSRAATTPSSVTTGPRQGTTRQPSVARNSRTRPCRHRCGSSSP